MSLCRPRHRPRYSWLNTTWLDWRELHRLEQVHRFSYAIFFPPPVFSQYQITFVLSVDPENNLKSRAEIIIVSG